MMSISFGSEQDLSDLERYGTSNASSASEEDPAPLLDGAGSTEPAPVERPAQDTTAPAPTFDGVELHLLEQLRAKDPNAFKAFVGTHHRAMVRFAMQFVRSRASAEEVTQDTWLAALDGIGQFEGRSSVVSWIYAILINKAKSRGRRDSRDRALAPGAGDLLEEGGTVVQDLPGDSFDPERILAGREIGDLIQKLIGDLPELQRAVITLQDLQGQDSASICQALNLTDANRRVLLHRARGRLRRELNILLGELPPGARRPAQADHRP